MVGTPGGNNNSQFAESRTRSRESMRPEISMAEVEWIVQYRINNPRLFLFVMNPESTFAMFPRR